MGKIVNLWDHPEQGDRDATDDETVKETLLCPSVDHGVTLVIHLQQGSGFLRNTGDRCHERANDDRCASAAVEAERNH